MDCEKCGTWNPDDKRVCWRCQAELPKPVEQPRRKQRVFLGLPMRSWGWIALFVTFLIAAQCLGPLLNPGQ